MTRRSTASGRTKVRSRWQRSLLAAGLVAGVAMGVTFPASPTGAAVVADFEIDGDLTPNTDIPPSDDWNNVDASTQVDASSSSGDDVFSGNNTEQHSPSAWNVELGNVGQAASDVTMVRKYSRVDAADDQWFFMGLHRAGSGGNMAVHIELNQNQNQNRPDGLSIPDRAVGDLLILFERSGTAFSPGVSYRWNGSAWGERDGSVPFTSAISTNGLFMEVAFNFTELGFEADCDTAGFQTANVRTSVSSALNSNFADYVEPVDVSIPPRCAVLDIRKEDSNGILVTGATFEINPDPGDGVGTLLATDGGEGDRDGVANGIVNVDTDNFGEYTVTEAVPPLGYIPDPEPQMWDAQPFSETELTFTNTLGSISWEKRDAQTGDLVCCATFSVVGVAGAAANEPWNIDVEVTDNDGLLDANTDVGQIEVTGLPTGTYTITESEPPAGYQLASPPSRTAIEVSAAAPDTVIGDDFQNPQILTDLSVLKWDVDVGEVLAGAVFQLYLDADGQEPGDEPGEGDTPVGGPCTTDSAGMCTVTGLNFGSYFWYEVAAPPGHELPTNRTSTLIFVSAGNAGDVTPYRFTNPRVPGATEVLKRDATDPEGPLPLQGATVDLVLDGDGDGTYDPEADQPVGQCTTGSSGTCRIEDLDFGTYWWVEVAPPTGYALSENPVSEAVVISADNVGDVQLRTFDNPRLPSELPVQKLDGLDRVTQLPGAAFDLVLDDGDGVYEEGTDDVIGSCVTAADGTCSVAELDFGTYFWVETAAPPGYVLPPEPVSDPIIVDATNAGTTRSVTVFLDPQASSQLIVEKLDAVTGESLARAMFALYRDVDGDGEGGVTGEAADPDDSVVDTCRTQAPTGTCTVEAPDFGTYYWFELSAPRGYEPPTDRTSAMITIDASNAGGPVAPTVFENPQVLSELRVLKLDATDESPLAGATFALVLDDGDAVYEPEQDDVVDDCTTELPDGTCSVVDLIFGTYFWVETDPSPGYDMPADPVSAPIVIDAESAGSVREPSVFSDPRLLTNVSVLKLDATNDDPLDGAVFQLHLDNGDAVADPGVDSPIGEPCTTGADGPGLCTVTGLDFGDYFWFEVSPPPGFDAPGDRSSAMVIVDASSAGGTVTVPFSNPRTLSELSVRKVDAITAGPLAGGTFGLYLDDGDGAFDQARDAPVDSCTTTAPEGTCSIDGVGFGTYFWLEIAPPAGYLLPDPPYSDPIVIDAANAGTEIAPFTFADEPETAGPSPAPAPPTDGDPLPGTGVSPLWLIVVAGLTVAVGAVLAAASGRRRTRRQR